MTDAELAKVIFDAIKECISLFGLSILVFSVGYIKGYKDRTREASE